MGDAMSEAAEYMKWYDTLDYVEKMNFDRFCQMKKARELLVNFPQDNEKQRNHKKWATFVLNLRGI
jgi:hypothetical protein